MNSTCSGRRSWTWRSSADFIIVDTPGFDTNLTRLAHSLADTLVTPLNDSLIDIDVLAHIDPVSGEPRELSHYARLVQRARKERLAIDGRTIDWVLVRNRIAMLSSRNMRLVQSGLEQIATRLGCRVADGIAERVIFRSLFPLGLTVFDELDDDTLGGAPNTSHEGAQQEYRQLVHALNLPVSDRVRARREWLVASAAPNLFEHLSALTGPFGGLRQRRLAAPIVFEASGARSERQIDGTAAVGGKNVKVDGDLGLDHPPRSGRKRQNRAQQIGRATMQRAQFCLKGKVVDGLAARHLEVRGCLRRSGDFRQIP